MSEKKILRIEVRNKIARLVDCDEFLVCGNNDYEVHFDFDEAWNEHHAKTALFVFGDETIKQPFKDNVCDGVAIEKATRCYIGVFSGDLVTTTKAEVKCVPSIRDIAKTPKPPKEDVYNKLIALINSIKVDSTKVIINVEELPEKDINYNAFYRTEEGIFWYDTEWHKVPTWVDLEEETTRAKEAEKKLEDNKQDNLSFDGGYDKDTNKVATVGTVESKVGELERNLDGRIDTVERVAKGATQSKSYHTYGDMIAELNILPQTSFNIGQNFYIDTLSVPDLWVSDISTTSVPYEHYTTEDAFAFYLAEEKRVKVGYFILSALETQKVDLVDYAKKEEVETAVNNLDTRVTQNSSLAQSAVEVASATLDTASRAKALSEEAKTQSDEANTQSEQTAKNLTSAVDEFLRLIGVLNDADKAETARAEGEESRIEAKLDAETVRAKKAESDNATAIANEHTRATQKETEIDNRLTSHISTYNEKVRELEVADQSQAEALLGLEKRLEALLASDDVSLDQLQEIVDYIKNNKNLIDGITTSKVNVSDIIDNLLSTATNKPLSANQGRILKDLIEAEVTRAKQAENTKENKGEITTTGGDTVRLFIGTVEAFEALEDKSNVVAFFTDDPMIANLNAMAKGIEKNEKDISDEVTRAKEAESNRVSKTEYFDIIPDQGIKDTFNPSFNDGDCARAYVVARDTNGKSREDSILVSKYIKGHSLALRDQSGRLFTGKAEDKNHCVNKDYVDNTKKEIENLFEDAFIYIKGTEGLKYSLSDDGTYYICEGIGSSKEKDIVIATIYEGKLVKSIGYGAFRDRSSLTSITIPDGVTSIGDYAFCGCRNLTSITIPNSVTSIGDYAFSWCSNLTSVTIPNSVTSIDASAFSECSNLTSVTIPNSVTSIDASAFSECASLTSVTIPNSVTSIGDQAFDYCSNLTSIIIPNSVTSIGYSAFDGDTNLTIYCEAKSQPSGWHSNWNDANRPVVWGTPRLDAFEAAHAMTADLATKATQDNNGNDIANTYAKISAITGGTITAKKADSASELTTSISDVSLTNGQTTRRLTLYKAYIISISIAGIGSETMIMQVNAQNGNSHSSISASGYKCSYNDYSGLLKITTPTSGTAPTWVSIREI